MTDDDAVGYGKPPKHSQFKKGQSGNPRGRPKGRKTYRASFDDILNETVVVTENGRKKRMRKLELVLRQMMNKAAGGDYRAIKAMLSCCRAMGYEDDRSDGLIVVINGRDAEV
jgi:uncharacterized protein DUF5681